MNSTLTIINTLLMLALSFVRFRTENFEDLLNKFHFNRWNIRKNLQDENARRTVKWLVIWGWAMLLVQLMNAIDINYEFRAILGIFIVSLYIKILWILTVKKEDFYVSSFTIVCAIFFIVIGFITLWNGSFAMFSLLNLAVLFVSLIFLFRGVKFYKEEYFKILCIIGIWFLVCKIILEVSYIYSNNDIKAISGMKNILDGLMQTMVVTGGISYVATFIDKSKDKQENRAYEECEKKSVN